MYRGLLQIQEELNKWGLNFKSDLTVCSGHIATNTDVCISLGNTEFVPKPFGWSQEMTSKCLVIFMQPIIHHGC